MQKAYRSFLSMIREFQCVVIKEFQCTHAYDLVSRSALIVPFHYNLTPTPLFPLPTHNSHRGDWIPSGCVGGWVRRVPGGVGLGVGVGADPASFLGHVGLANGCSGQLQVKRELYDLRTSLRREGEHSPLICFIRTYTWTYTMYSIVFLLKRVAPRCAVLSFWDMSLHNVLCTATYTALTSKMASRKRQRSSSDSSTVTNKQKVGYSVPWTTDFPWHVPVYDTDSAESTVRNRSSTAL